MFGTTQLFVFADPNAKAAKQATTVTFEMAQEEIATQSGFDMSLDNKSRGTRSSRDHPPSSCRAAYAHAAAA